MQMVVFMATQKSHSGLSTCRVKSVGKQVGTAGLNSKNRSQQEKTAVSILVLNSDKTLLLEDKERNKASDEPTENKKSGISNRVYSPGDVCSITWCRDSVALPQAY